MLAYSILLQLATLLTCVRASSSHPFPLHLVKRQSATTTTVPGFNISIPIDHFNASDTRSYINQYWVNDTWYQPGGPVFFYDLGEQGVSPLFLNLVIANDTSSITALAKKYHGLILCWEHRYFGGSLPFPLNLKANTSILRNEPVGAPASYQYLTFEQALEDVVYFANNLDKGGYQPNDLPSLHPSKTPWIWLGGSYSAVRGAALRIRNPEVIYGTWASSAPVQAIYSGASYISASARSLPSNCSTDVFAITRHIDNILAGPQTAQEYKDLQNLTYISTIASYQSFTQPFNYSLARTYTPFTIANTIALFWPSNYQKYGPALVTHPFCNFLESYNPKVPGAVLNNTITAILSNPGTAIPSPQGFLATNGNNLTLAVYAYFYAQVRNSRHILTDIYNVTLPSEHVSANTVSPLRTNSGMLTLDGLNPDNMDPAYNFLADSSAWLYLVNTEFGWFQAYDGSYSTPGNNITSRFFNITYDKANDRRAKFDPATIQSLPNTPNTDAFNRYGGWNMTPSNVMFTDGDSDPWRAGSVFSQETELGGPNRPITTVVPACGKPPEGNAVYGALYPGAAHVWDMSQNSFVGGKNGIGLTEDGRTPQQVGLDLFTKALDVWLPCFIAGR